MTRRRRRDRQGRVARRGRVDVAHVDRASRRVRRHAACEWKKLDAAVLVLDEPVDWIVPLKPSAAPAEGATVQALGFGRCRNEHRPVAQRTGRCSCARPTRSRSRSASATATWAAGSSTAPRGSRDRLAPGRRGQRRSPHDDGLPHRHAARAQALRRGRDGREIERREDRSRPRASDEARPLFHPHLRLPLRRLSRSTATWTATSLDTLSLALHRIDPTYMPGDFRLSMAPGPRLPFQILLVPLLRTLTFHQILDRRTARALRADRGRVRAPRGEGRARRGRDASSPGRSTCSIGCDICTGEFMVVGVESKALAYAAVLWGLDAGIRSALGSRGRVLRPRGHLPSGRRRVERARRVRGARWRPPDEGVATRTLPVFVLAAAPGIVLSLRGPEGSLESALGVLGRTSTSGILITSCRSIS